MYSTHFTHPIFPFSVYFFPLLTFFGPSKGKKLTSFSKSIKYSPILASRGSARKFLHFVDSVIEVKSDFHFICTVFYRYPGWEKGLSEIRTIGLPSDNFNQSGSNEPPVFGEGVGSGPTFYWYVGSIPKISHLPTLSLIFEQAVNSKVSFARR